MVQDKEALLTVVGMTIGFIVWLVRLEGKVNYTDRMLNDAKLEYRNELSTLKVKHEQLDSKIVEQLSEVRESLARLEGALGVNRKDG